VVELDVLELEDHVHLAPRRIGEQPRLLDGHAGHLTDRQVGPGPGVEDLPPHLGEELVDARPADVVPPAAAVGVGQAGLLGDQVDDVHAEAVHAAVEPPAHHRVDGLPDLGVLPVEVGLLA
jgi:hypothetical protein